MVLDEVWREISDVDALSGADGGPLRRTVKLILDPLVLRPMQHPVLASSVLDEDGIALLTALVHAQSDALRACAAWFVVLKQVRRRLRITEGNAQDLYFQRCFELATVAGAPEGVSGHARAEATLREVHDSTGGRTTASLKRHVTEPRRAAELAELLGIAWARRPLAPYAARDLAAELTELLEACTLAHSGDPADAGPLFDDLLDNRAGTHRGIALWLEHPEAGADDLGLTTFSSPQRPELGASASTASLGLPFDRTVYERVFTVLQGSIDRTDLPEIPELVTREISRSCSRGDCSRNPCGSPRRRVPNWRSVFHRSGRPPKNSTNECRRRVRTRWSTVAGAAKGMCCRPVGTRCMWSTDRRGRSRRWPPSCVRRGGRIRAGCGCGCTVGMCARCRCSIPASCGICSTVSPGR